ncbi:MAG: hypothetical protein ABIR47_12705 [Candidatus Kapaibacterium sp.]
MERLIGCRNIARCGAIVLVVLLAGCGAAALEYSVQRTADAVPHASPESIQIFRAGDKPARPYTVIGTIESNRRNRGHDSTEMLKNFREATTRARSVAAEMGGDAILSFMFYTGGMTAAQLDLPNGAGVYRGTVVRY